MNLNLQRQITENVRKRYWVLIGIGAFFIFVVYLYIASEYYTAVKLFVNAVCIGNGTQLVSCDGITLQDSDMEKSLKLKEALVKAPLAHSDTGGNRIYAVEMTPAEFDSMNSMIISANPEVAKSYNPNDWQNPNPTKAIWPTEGVFVHVAYKGNVYRLHPSYFAPEPLTPWVWDWHPKWE
jgi:hypothetical protein